MRIKIFIFLLLASLNSFGQGWTEQNVGVKTTVRSNGGFTADTSLLAPIRDSVKPVWWNDAKRTYNGQIQFLSSGTPVYYFNGWHVLGSGGGGGSGTVTSITFGNGFVPSVNPITTSGTVRADTGRAPTQLVTGGSLNKVSDSLNAIISTKGSGTVTNITTNYGINGGVITTAGIISADTSSGGLSTKAWRQKGVDSLNAVKQNNVTLTTTGTSGSATFNPTTGALNIPVYSGGGGGGVSSVTATSPVNSSGGTTPNITVDTGRNAGYLVTGGTLNKVKDSLGAITVKYADTSSMFAGYLRKGDTASMLANYIVNGINGITKTGKNLGLGGALTGATTITTTGSNTLALAGLQSGSTNDSVVMADATTGVLKRVSSSRFGGGGGGLTTSGTVGYAQYLSTSTNLANSAIYHINSSTIGVGVTASILGVSSFITGIEVRGGGTGTATVLSDQSTFGQLQSYSYPLCLNVTGMPVGIGNNSPSTSTKLDVTGNLRATNLTSSSTIPSVAVGAGAGSTGSAVITTNGTNNGYQVVLTVAGTVATGILFTVTMSGSFAASANMFPTFSPVDASAAALGTTQAVRISGTTTTHVMNSGSVALTAGTYTWNITCTPKL